MGMNLLGIKDCPHLDYPRVASMDDWWDIDLLVSETIEEISRELKPYGADLICELRRNEPVSMDDNIIIDQEEYENLI